MLNSFGRLVVVFCIKILDGVLFADFGDLGMIVVTEFDVEFLDKNVVANIEFIGKIFVDDVEILGKLIVVDFIVKIDVADFGNLVNVVFTDFNVEFFVKDVVVVVKILGNFTVVNILGNVFADGGKSFGGFVVICIANDI